MTFYCINTGRKNPTIVRLLSRACDKTGVDFVELKSERFDYTIDPSTYDDSLMYRISLSHSAVNAERFIMTFAKRVATFYKSAPIALRGRFDARSANLLFAHAGVPILKTIFDLTRDKRIIKQSVEHLGGLPVILKTVNGQRGQGVIKIDSYQGLFSTIDYLYDHAGEFIMQEFIDTGSPPHSIRALVIGDEVVGAYKKTSTDEHDFRSNVRLLDKSKPKMHAPVELVDEHARLLVRAVHALGFEMGGVDFVNINGELKLFEVNYPFNFKRIPTYLNFPIHEHLVHYLSDKQRSLFDKNR